MGVSRMTVWMIQANEVEVIDKADRSEAWLIKAGAPHALLLSCPHEKRHEMEQFIRELKAEAQPASQPESTR